MSIQDVARYEDDDELTPMGRMARTANTFVRETILADYQEKNRQGKSTD